MRTCERLVSMGRFRPTEPAGLLARSYYELLENKQPILGKQTNKKKCQNWFTIYNWKYCSKIDFWLLISFLGSSTACVIVLNKETSSIYAANIGDSGFVVVRRGEVVHRSSEQQHYFNTPFQLSLPPPGHSDMVLRDRYISFFICYILTIYLIACNNIYIIWYHDYHRENNYE